MQTDFIPLFQWYSDVDIQRGSGRTELKLLLFLRRFKLVLEQRENIFIC